MASISKTLVWKSGSVVQVENPRVNFYSYDVVDIGTSLKGLKGVRSEFGLRLIAKLLC